MTGNDLTPLDELLAAGPVWEPPPGFAQRVATLAVAAHVAPRLSPPRAPLLAVLREQIALRLEGPRWAMRQYVALVNSR